MKKKLIDREKYQDIKRAKMDKSRNLQRNNQKKLIDKIQSHLLEIFKLRKGAGYMFLSIAVPSAFGQITGHPCLCTRIWFVKVYNKNSNC